MQTRTLAGAAVAVAGLLACSEPTQTATAQEADAAPPAVTVTEDSFRCIRDMTPVRGFFVDNLLGDLEATVAVAESPEGGTYPPGSIVQLVPTEAMVKHQPGASPETNDWEFLELDVAAEGATIRARGAADVVNRFGGNCFECHRQAAPQWDMICENDHGCAPIPLTEDMFRAIQNTDPRCPAVELPPEQVQALEALAAFAAPAEE